jgi:hypothetical protein
METDPELGTPERDRLDTMVNLVQTYEAFHYPLSLGLSMKTLRYKSFIGSAEIDVDAGIYFGRILFAYSDHRDR